MPVVHMWNVKVAIGEMGCMVDADFETKEEAEDFCANYSGVIDHAYLGMTHMKTESDEVWEDIDWVEVANEDYEHCYEIAPMGYSVPGERTPELACAERSIACQKVEITNLKTKDHIASGIIARLNEREAGLKKQIDELTKALEDKNKIIKATRSALGHCVSDSSDMSDDYEADVCLGCDNIDCLECAGPANESG
jgi:hypothetical protein